MTRLSRVTRRWSSRSRRSARAGGGRRPPPSGQVEAGREADAQEIGGQGRRQDQRGGKAKRSPEGVARARVRSGRS